MSGVWLEEVSARCGRLLECYLTRTTALHVNEPV